MLPIDTRDDGSSSLVIVILFAQWLTGPVMIARADEPQPDPAGIATGDKTSTSDAGGTSFIVDRADG